jgi:hypothetical protein
MNRHVCQGCQQAWCVLLGCVEQHDQHGSWGFVRRQTSLMQLAGGTWMNSIAAGSKCLAGTMCACLFSGFVLAVMQAELLPLCPLLDTFAH